MLSRGRCFCYYHYVPSRLRGWASSFLGLLIGGCAIPVNLIVSHGVAVLTHRVARVALHRVDAAILHLLHNPHMVGRTVLASIIPVEKDDVAGARLIAVILPQPALLKPRDALGRTGCKLWNNTSSQSRRTIPHGCQSRTSSNRAHRLCSPPERAPR